MTTALEFPARALRRLDGHPENATIEGKPRGMDYLREARTVLAAIREPNAFMAAAGAETIRNVGPDESGEAHQSDAANTWRFMFDAALAEQP